MSDADKRPLDIVPPLAADPVFAEAVDEAVLGDAAEMPGARVAHPIGSDPHDFAGLYIRHRSSFAAHARRFMRDQRDVDEVVQEAFLRLFLALPELETELQALAYCRRTITNLCIDRYRADQRRPRLVDLDCLPDDVFSDASEDDPVIRAEDAMIVREALSLLSPLHREALIKREIEEKPLPQIALELEVPEESVKHLLHRARRALRRLLVGTSVEPGSDPDVLTLLRQRAASGGGRLATALLIVVGLAVMIPRVEDLGPVSTVVGVDRLTDAFSHSEPVGRPPVSVDERPVDKGDDDPEGSNPSKPAPVVPQELPRAPEAAAKPSPAPVPQPQPTSGIAVEPSGDEPDRDLQDVPPSVGREVGDEIAAAPGGEGRSRGDNPPRHSAPAPSPAVEPAPDLPLAGGRNEAPKHEPRADRPAPAPPAPQLPPPAASSKSVAPAAKPPPPAEPAFAVDGLSGPVRHVGVESHGVGVEPDGTTVAHSRFIAIADGGALELMQEVRVGADGAIAVAIEPIRFAADGTAPQSVSSTVTDVTRLADGRIEFTVLATVEQTATLTAAGLVAAPPQGLMATETGPEAAELPVVTEAGPAVPPTEAVSAAPVNLHIKIVFLPRPAEVLAQHVTILG